MKALGFILATLIYTILCSIGLYVNCLVTTNDDFQEIIITILYFLYILSAWDLTKKFYYWFNKHIK
jgi:hypothetical protein